MENIYHVRKFIGAGKEIRVKVPGSKSITNRALLLAALSDKRCTLHGVLFSDDSRAFLDCLEKLGFALSVNEQAGEVSLQGTGGRIPNPHAEVNVRSAGTAARFLTVMPAFAGGENQMQASPQMCRRPMKPLLGLLEKAGVSFQFQGQTGHFPFFMKSKAPSLGEVEIDTGISSQFASALLMSGILLRDGLKITMLGDRAEGAYIKMTIAMMKQFGISVEREGGKYLVPPKKAFGLEEYQVEPDVSGAGYFYAMAPLLQTEVMVENVHMDSLQGDIKFLEVLKEEDYKDAIISESEAIDLIKANSLLIIVDTHKTSYVEFPELLDKVERKIVIDHHRKAPDCIENALVSFHEVYASSTAELVTEIVQYAQDNVELKLLEAESLYGGIMVDTKDFTFKTGVRTFEAAAYLRKYGVDIIRVKKWFQADLESYNIISNIVRNVEIHNDTIAISIFEDENEDSNLIIAKAADELLTISDITASFVMAKVQDKVYISGRSIGDINVQLILEKLGGGGHITLAGAQLEGFSLEDARNELVIRINEYLLETE